MLASNSSRILRRGSVANEAADYGLVWVDRAGRESPVDTALRFRHVQYGANAGWSLSPDGSRLAIGINTSAGDDIWVINSFSKYFQMTGWRLGFGVMPKALAKPGNI